jgi:hypothetical protein
LQASLKFLDTVLIFQGDSPNVLKNFLCVSADQSQEHCTHWNNKFEMRLSLFLFTSYGTMLSLCLPGCRSIRKVLGPN